MRVLHLTRDYPPHVRGGVSTAVQGLVRASVDVGIECAVISFDSWRPFRAANAPSEPASTERDRVLRVLCGDPQPAVLDFACAIRPEILHVHCASLWETAAEIGASLGVPRILSVHVLHAEQDRLRGLIAPTWSAVTQARALREATLIAAPSRAVAEKLGTSDRVRLAPLGIGEVPAAASALAAPREPILLFAGRFADVKGFAELGPVLARVAVRCPAARFEVAGGLPDNQKAERRAIRRLLCDLGPAGERLQLLGWLDSAGLEAALRRAAVLLHPSRFETFGQMLLEAMLFGLPPVATRAGGVPELVEHGETGLLAEVGDIGALAESAACLLEDPGLARLLGARAFCRVRERHLWRQVIGAHVALYEEALRGPRSS